MSDPNLEVQLTDYKNLHCFKVIYHIQLPNFGTTEPRAPLEIYLHATQAFDLFQKLGQAIMEYFAKSSAELLRHVYEHHEARELLKETLQLLQKGIVHGWFDGVPRQVEKIDGFLAITEAVNHPPAEPTK